MIQKMMQWAQIYILPHRVILSFNLISWIESPRSRVAVTLSYSSPVRSSDNLADWRVSAVFKTSAAFMAWLWLSQIIVVSESFPRRYTFEYR